MSRRIEAALPFWLDRPDAEALDIAVEVGQAGLDALWIGEMATFDAFALAAAVGHRAPGLALKLGPLAIGVRSPVTIALGASSVAALTGSEVDVALGASSPAIVAGWHDREWAHSAARMRETIECLRTIFAGDAAAYRSGTRRSACLDRLRDRGRAPCRRSQHRRRSRRSRGHAEPLAVFRGTTGRSPGPHAPDQNPNPGACIVTLVNAQCRLAARPVGLPKPSDWDVVEEPAADPGGGEFRVQVEYLSIDPAMRSWMNEGRSYVPPVGIGEVMRAAGIGRVMDSRHPGFQVGEDVYGVFGVQRYAVSDGRGVTRVDTTIAPAPVHLGVLGVGGLTAYVGLLDVGRPEPGQTVVVSGAAGSVGSIVGQIARIKGCRVVGIAGGPDKCRWIVEDLGFDAAIDYKAGNVRSELKAHAPDGVDVFFDNVGGVVLEGVLARLARGARVVICGAVSQYNATEPPPGPSNYMQLLVARATMTGFVIFDHADRYGEGVAQLASWLQSGELRSHEDVVHGDVAEFPDVLLRLFRGENTGKLVLALDGAR